MDVQIYFILLCALNVRLELKHKNTFAMTIFTRNSSHRFSKFGQIE